MKGKAVKHTHCRKGTKVLIKLLSGEKFEDIFMEKKGGATILLKAYGKIRQGKIWSMAVIK